MHTPSRLAFRRNVMHWLLALSAMVCPLPLFSAPLTLGQPIVVPGTKGGFDFLQVDQPLHRLLANHTGNKSFDVFNLPDGKLIKSVDTGAAQGVALDTQHNCYYVTVSDQKKLVEIDRSSLAVNKVTDLPGPPDALAYFPKTSMVYVGHDDGEDLWVVDPSAQKIVATIKIPTAPEYILYDPAFDGIFQNIKSQPVMLVIDGTANTVSATWSTLPAVKPHGLAIDPKTRRLFSAGGNGKLVIMDCTTGVCLKSVDIAPGQTRSRSMQETSGSIVPAAKVSSQFWRRPSMALNRWAMSRRPKARTRWLLILTLIRSGSRFPKKAAPTLQN